jgi:AcrR family transcriptional regulator
MPPIKKIFRDVIELHHAVHADYRRRDADGTTGKARLKAILHGAIDGSKRVRALDGDDKEARRQAILDAAARLFAEHHGPANVAAVAEAAGLAKGTVYLYFQTKEEIYLALHARDAGHFFTTLIELLNRGEAVGFDEILALNNRHLLNSPTYMPLGACCIGFAANAVPLVAAQQFQQQMTTWLVAAGAGLERHFTRLAPGEGVRLLKHSYALMIGLYSLRDERGAEDPKCPIIPGMGTYQEEASLALTRYWAQVTGLPDTTQTPQASKSPKSPKV